MSSYTLRFIKYLLGFRGAETGYTDAELEFLALLALRKKCIVKFGVEEGVDSKVFCQNMECNGKLYIVDPFHHFARLEKILNFSFAKFISKQCVKDYGNLVQFVKMTSLEASKSLDLDRKVDLVFINHRHDYESVLEDFRSWALMLSNEGIMAFPYSRICKNRPYLNYCSGALILCNEIARGEHGNWKVVDTLEWITVISAGSSREDAII